MMIMLKMMIIMRDATLWTCLHTPVAVANGKNNRRKTKIMMHDMPHKPLPPSNVAPHTWHPPPHASRGWVYGTTPALLPRRIPSMTSSQIRQCRTDHCSSSGSFDAQPERSAPASSPLQAKQGIGLNSENLMVTMTSLIMHITLGITYHAHLFRQKSHISWSRFELQFKLNHLQRNTK